jgi:hypothetical protein
MPLSSTVCVPPFALSVIVSVPVCLFATLGANFTEIVQEDPALRLAGQSLVCMNTPGSEIISINTEIPGCFLLPLGLDTFTVFRLLDVPTIVFGNFRRFGLILSVTGTGVAVAVAVGVDVAVAVAVGVKVAVTVVVAVSVGVAVGVAVAVKVAVAVGIEVFVAVGVVVGVAVAIGVGVGVSASTASNS